VADGGDDRPLGELGDAMIVESHEHIEPLAHEWDELADRVDAAPWLRPGWIRAWRRAFGRGKLELLTVRRDGRLVGVLALERRLGALRSASNWHTPAFGALTADDAALRELVGALLAGGGRRVALAFLAADDPVVATCCAAAAAAAFRLIVRLLERSPYVVVDGDWAAYEARRDTKLLRELRRRRRRLDEQGRLALEVGDGSDRLDELLDEGFRVEAAGWKGERGSAVASDAATRCFYGDVARWAAERGWLRLAFLRLDGRPLAFDYCLEQGGVHYLLKTGYDPAYRAFGPGMLIRHEMLERAFASELSRYEFLGDEEPWKLDWTERSRERVLLQAFAPSAPGLVDWAAFAYGRPLAKRALARLGA
jgi:CelD/BcsL family acetyltransferase involved in cellulose biosynthesis